MFSAGDKVVYPLYGGAVINSVEHRVLDNGSADYYILHLVLTDMIVALPVARAQELGLRAIVSPQELQQAKVQLRARAPVDQYKRIAWNRRNMLYTQQLKRGSIQDVSGVLRILWEMDRSKRISLGEKKLLHEARNIFISELMLVEDLPLEQAQDWLENCLAS